MRILAIGAHPDDIEFGCGGTLIKYARQGHEPFLLVMTDGSGGGDGALRQKEQEASARILRASRLIWGGYPDTALPPGPAPDPAGRASDPGAASGFHLRALP